MSRTWKLVNPEGEPEFTGPMDLEFHSDGRFTELTGGDLLGQRVKKAVVTLRNSNRFDPDYGTNLRRFLGGKITQRDNALGMGVLLEELINYLLSSQSEVRRRIGDQLTPDELLDSARKFKVTYGNTEVQLAAELLTEGDALTVEATV